MLTITDGFFDMDQRCVGRDGLPRADDPLTGQDVPSEPGPRVHRQGVGFRAVVVAIDFNQ